MISIPPPYRPGPRRIPNAPACRGPCYRRRQKHGKHCRRSRMFVKVCGLSTPESVRTAAEAGADAVGFVLTRSPREVTPAQARELLAHVPAGLPAVGVFRHEAAADAVVVAREAGLGWVQLHGDRTPEDVDTVHDAGLKLIR